MENEEKNDVMPEVIEEIPPENQFSATETAIATDRELAELDAYKRHTEALKIELAEIRERFGDDDGGSAVDPLKDIRAEMAEMKSGFAEIKAMFEELRNNNNNGSSNNPPPASGQPQPYYFQQPTPAMPPPIMPFYQTPSFPPIIPAIPTFNSR